MNKLELMKTANEVRKGIVTAVHSAKAGHPGGSLSAADLFTYLYFEELNVDPADPKKADRDRFVLSKGHAGPALYATLALKKFFPMDWLNTLNKLGTRLPSHVNLNLTPGVDMTAGSLGQGLSCACGLALAQKAQGFDNYVYVIMGDGELQEGQNWEGAMFAGAKKLNNIIVFVDNNKMQIDGLTSDVLPVEDIEAKFKAFGFAVDRVDGHDHAMIDHAIQHAKKDKTVAPHCIVLDTVKGKGVSFYEALGPSNHSTSVNNDQFEQALAELK